MITTMKILKLNNSAENVSARALVRIELRIVTTDSFWIKYFVYEKMTIHL